MAYPSGARSQSRLDAYQDSNLPFVDAQTFDYSSLRPWSQPSFVFSDTTSSEFSSFPSDLGGATYHHPPSHSTKDPPASLMPLMASQSQPMNNGNFQAFDDYFNGTCASTASSTPDTRPSEYSAYHERFAQNTSQFSFPTQYEAAFLQNQEQVQSQFYPQPEAPPAQHLQQVQSYVQAAPQDFEAEELGEDEGDDGQVHEEPPAAPIYPQTSHICEINQDSACPGHGPVCVDLLSLCIQQYPETFTATQVAWLMVLALTSAARARRSSVGHNSTIDANNSLTTAHGAVSRKASSSSSRTIASNPGSPSGSHLSPPDNFVAAPESSAMGAARAGPSTGKRRRSQTEDDVEGGDRTHRHYNFRHERGCPSRKRRRPAVDGDYICVLCWILGGLSPALSRKDSLRRHIVKLHPTFVALLEEDQLKRFMILEPRTVDDLDNSEELIKFCIEEQSKAKLIGANIQEDHDLALLYPHVARSAKPENVSSETQAAPL